MVALFKREADITILFLFVLLTKEKEIRLLSVIFLLFFQRKSVADFTIISLA
jgi:hypothetical protein